MLVVNKFIKLFIFIDLSTVQGKIISLQFVENLVQLVFPFQTP